MSFSATAHPVTLKLISRFDSLSMCAAVEAPGTRVLRRGCAIHTRGVLHPDPEG